MLLVPVLAVRAERRYGIPRAKAEARILRTDVVAKAQTRREAARRHQQAAS
jgi:hypothetical protein